MGVSVEQVVEKYNEQQLGEADGEFLAQVKEVVASPVDIWVFGTTPLLPTYLYGFCVGEFSEIKFEGPYNQHLLEVPSSLYFRETNRRHVERMAPLLFEANLASLKIYERNFQVKFPFKKHDLVFC